MLQLVGLPQGEPCVRSVRNACRSAGNRMLKFSFFEGQGGREKISPEPLGCVRTRLHALTNDRVATSLLIASEVE